MSAKKRRAAPARAGAAFSGAACAVPAAFSARMRALLGESEYAAFCAAQQSPPRAGLRLNLLKCRDAAAFARETGFALVSLPFAEEGFALPAGQANGRHPWHHAGLFYLQEPSAMSAVSALDPRPGERVLDLCAAPGGKSTQIAARLGGKGVLVSNEVMPGRAAALLSNLERFGVCNAVVYNETPQRLCAAYEGWFDAVLVDAPCSGEGMFRREPAAARDWTENTPAACARRQTDILKQAARTVRPGGRLVYSTCTFAPEENEGVLAAFLRAHPHFSVSPITRAFGRPARPDWAGADVPESLAHARRVLPQDGGEGHFVALLHRADGAAHTMAAGDEHSPAALPEEAAVFFAAQFAAQFAGVPALRGETLWLLPAALPAPPPGLRLLRAGLCAGWLKKGRFEPAHALYLAAAPGACLRALNLPLGDARLDAFLRGQTLETELTDGYAAVLAAGHAVGFGKVSDGVLKNHYPRALRLL